MPRVPVSQGNSARLAPVSDAKVQPLDWNPGIGASIEALGRAAATAVDQVDGIQELYDRQDANRLDLEHLEHVRILGDRLRESRGTAAQEAANQIGLDLTTTTRELLSRARSPRARRFLEVSVGRRAQEELGRFHAYGDDEFVQGYRATSDARINSAQERIDDIQDGAEARAAFEGEGGPVAALRDRASFEGWEGGLQGPQGQAALLRLTTRYHMTRYQTLARAGDPLAARAYLDSHRDEMADDAWNSASNSVTEAARQQWARNYIRGDRRPFSEATGQEPGSAPAPTPAPANDTAPAPPAPRPAPAPPARDDGRPFAIPGGFTAGNGATARRGNSGKGTHGAIDVHAPAGTPWRFNREIEVLPGSHRQQVVRDGRDGGNIARVRIGNTIWKAMHLPNLPAAGTYGPNDPVIMSGLSGIRNSPAHIHWQPENAAARAIFAQGRRATVAFLTGGAAPGGETAGGAPSAESSLEGQIAAVEADRNLSWADRQTVVSVLRSDHAEQRQARAEAFDQADRDAARAMLSLGDTFTDVNQLPADIIGRMDPRDVARYQSTARANRDRLRARANDEIAPDILLEYNYQRIANPGYFASPEFRRWLQDRGAPSSIIRNWAGESGQILGAIERGTRDPVSVANERLWSIARPALEEVGLHFETIEAGRNSTARETERRDDARRKNTLLTRLRENVQIWTQAHPGQAPDDATIRGWVGNLLMNGGQDAHVFDLDDATLYQRLTPTTRQYLEGQLRARGVPPTPENVSRLWRRRIALYSRRQD